jgi:hypothetical protein
MTALRLASAVLLVVPTLYSHSVPTHQQITAAAVQYVQQQDARFSSLTATQLQIGTADEDAIPRYMFHFFPMLNTILFNATCRSVDWGFLPNLSDTCTQTGEPRGPSTLTNAHTWGQALLGARDPNQMDQGWVEVGYVLHLLEDLTSPAHTRNDPHPHFSVLGINLGNPDPLEVKDRVPAMPTTPLVDFTNPDDFFNNLQNLISSNFYSKDRVFQATGPSCPAPCGPPEGIHDADYIYDARNATRKIAYKGWRYRISGLTDATRDRTKATINSVIADEQWAELGPIAVVYAASFIHHYGSPPPAVHLNPSGTFDLSVAPAPPYNVEVVTPVTLMGVPAPNDINVSVHREVQACGSVLFPTDTTVTIAKGQQTIGVPNGFVAGRPLGCGSATTVWHINSASMNGAPLDLSQVPTQQLSLAITR